MVMTEMSMKNPLRMNEAEYEVGQCAIYFVKKLDAWLVDVVIEVYRYYSERGLCLFALKLPMTCLVDCVPILHE